ncbi:hypothetical protein OQA88_7346 [Cercophora sp. LCS_1]
MGKPYTHAEEKQAPQSTQTRKRQIDKPQPKRARLTRKNLALFDKMGKKGTSKAPPSASGFSPSTDGSLGNSSGSKKTPSTTVSGFAEQAYKNGIRQPPNAKPPLNLEDMRERLARSRATASPSEPECERYIDAVEEAPNEATMVAEVIRMLPRRYNDKGYKQVLSKAHA